MGTPGATPMRGARGLRRQAGRLAAAHPLFAAALAAGGLTAGYAVIVREAGLPVIAVLAGYALVKWRTWLLPLALAAGCVAPVAAYVAWLHSVNGQYLLTRSTGFYLWGRVSSFAECAKIRPPAPERRLCL